VQFGQTTLKKIYASFGEDIQMTLNPFVMGSATKPACFDEAPPCLLEQTSMCVISVTQQADAAWSALMDRTGLEASWQMLPGQDKYVPWLVCMDTNKDDIAKCHQEAKVDPDAVSQCMSSDAPELLKKYIKADAGIQATPTVHINGKPIKEATYKNIHDAICKADPSLKGCSSNAAFMPLWADTEPAQSYRPASQVESVSNIAMGQQIVV